jgi:hypothetical protein
MIKILILKSKSELWKNLEKLFKLWLCWSGKLGFFRALLFCVAKFSTLLGVKAYCKQQGAAVNAPPALFFKGAARCGSTDVVIGIRNQSCVLEKETEKARDNRH